MMCSVIVRAGTCWSVGTPSVMSRLPEVTSPVQEVWYKNVKCCFCSYELDIISFESGFLMSWHSQVNCFLLFPVLVPSCADCSFILSRASKKSSTEHFPFSCYSFKCSIRLLLMQKHSLHGNDWFLTHGAMCSLQVTAVRMISAPIPNRTRTSPAQH